MAKTDQLHRDSPAISNVKHVLITMYLMTRSLYSTVCDMSPVLSFYAKPVMTDSLLQSIVL